jgi:hypothetical protein
MSPLVVGPFLALLGIVAAFFVLRGKAKTRKSMYRTLREQRERDLRKARERATAAKGAGGAEKEAAAQAAAAAAAPAIQPAASASIPVQEAPQEYAAPPPPASPLPPPAYSPPEPPPPLPQAPPPVEQPAAAVLPEPPPTAGSKPAWEIVQPEKPEESLHAGAVGAGAAAGQASWELDPGEQKRMEENRTGREPFGEDDDGGGGRETLPQVLLSYAGLVAALLVILLGILFMIGAKATN